MSSSRLLSYVSVALLLAGCSAPATLSHTEAPPRSSGNAPSMSAPAVTVGVSDRPLPHPVVPPRAFARAVARGTRTEDGRPGPNYWQQQTQYTLEARLFPEAKRLEGAARIRYTNHSPDTLRILRLELAQNLHVEGAARNEPAEVTGGIRLHRVAVNGQVLEPKPSGSPGYLVQETLLLLEPHQTTAPGATAEIEVEWSFTIPQAGASERMGYSEDNLFFLAYWYPKMALYDDVGGWFTDTFASRSEFYHGFADYDVTVEAPEGWLVAATGTLANPDEVLAADVVERMRQAHQSDTPMQVVGPDDFEAATRKGHDGCLRWRFMATRVRDTAFSVMRQSIWEAARTPVGDRDGDGQTDYTAINTFYRPSAPRWKQVTRYQQHAITYHSAFTGIPYPWPHMTAVEGGGIIGGGMEFPMMTLIGDYNTSSDNNLYYVTAHELGHMWIPMIVGANERRYAWMDEGATTYLENQARFDFFPGYDHNYPDRIVYLTAARSEQEGEMMRRSNYHYSERAYGVATYSKPATVLVALRGLLGTETFMEAYRAFVHDWAYKHPSPYDFFNTFERISRRDLDWFWHSWYFETWTLDQAIETVIQRDGEADIVVQDLGNVPMPVRMTVTLDDGSRFSVVLPVETWLQGRREMPLTVTTPAPIARVEIDAEHRFPDIDRSNNVWTR